MQCLAFPREPWCSDVKLHITRGPGEALTTDLLSCFPWLSVITASELGATKEIIACYSIWYKYSNIQYVEQTKSLTSQMPALVALHSLDSDVRFLHNLFPSVRYIRSYQLENYNSELMFCINQAVQRLEFPSKTRQPLQLSHALATVETFL